MKRLWTIILSVLIGAAWGVGMSYFIAFDAWSGASPDAPRPATGQIWEQFNHGHSFYVTAFQASALKLLLTALFPGGLVFFAAFLLLPRRHGVRGVFQSDGWWPDYAGLMIVTELVAAALTIGAVILAGPRLVEWLMATGRLAPG